MMGWLKDILGANHAVAQARGPSRPNTSTGVAMAGPSIPVPIRIPVRSESSVPSRSAAGATPVGKTNLKSTASVRAQPGETLAIQLALVIDLNVCVGCHACVTSCKQWNTSGSAGPLADEAPYGEIGRAHV